jgi:radical SAM/Cys-rich protein
MDSSKQLEILSRSVGDDLFSKRLQSCGLSPLRSTQIDILQMNITYRCNLACKHCHVNASPKRTEMMHRDTLIKCIEIAQSCGISTIDITGGAPEMHPDLDFLLEHLCDGSRTVLVRSNLVILLESPWGKYLDIFPKRRVEIVASLPDYHGTRTDRVRGKNVFDRSIQGLRELNRRGYGQEGSGLVINLAHNPAGAYLPGNQTAIEQEFRRHLFDDYGIIFNNLFVLINNPINRFLEYLDQSGNLDRYMQGLRCAFNPVAATKVMCRNTVSVDWEGFIFDCDFNQQLGRQVNHGTPNHVNHFDFDRLVSREITVHEHCYACCAGAGSSCQGSGEQA